MIQCVEFTGRATATNQRRRCERQATNLVRFLGEWIAVCPRHRAMYSDLPMRKLDAA